MLTLVEWHIEPIVVCIIYKPGVINMIESLQTPTNKVAILVSTYVRFSKEYTWKEQKES